MSSNEKEVGTYILHNPQTDETYVGSGDLNVREYKHLATLKKGTHHNRQLQEAYNRNQNFEFVSVPMETREEALALEQAVLSEFWANPLLLNLSHSAYSCRPDWSEEQRAHHAEMMRGRQHSEETKARMSETQKIIQSDPRRKQQQHDRMLGNTHSLGFRRSDETKEKDRQASLGNTRACGYNHTEEAKEKISQALMRRWDDPIKRVQQSEFLKGKKIALGHKRPQEAIAATKAAVSRAVFIDGETYSSITEASRVLGIPYATVHHRVSSETLAFRNWRFL